MTSSGGNSSTVGFYLDDTPLTAPAGSFNGKVVIDPSLYDLNRVEVLRGPQGTLYGSGSMGGTIRLIPNAADPQAFASSVQTVFSDTDAGGFNRGENAMVNLPFAGGTAALRIVGTETHNSGWIDRIVIANGEFPLETNGNTTRGNVLAAPVAADYKKVNDEELTGARMSLLWKPTDRLDVTPSVFYQEIRQGGLNDIDSVPGTNANYQPFDTPEPFSDKFTLGSLNVQYRFDAFDLTSTTSRWTREERLLQDGTEEIQWAFSTPSASFPFYTSQGGLGPMSPAALEYDQTKQTSEEVRLTSSAASAFKWLVGYFYADFSSATDVNVNYPGAVALFGTSNGATILQPSAIIQNSFFGEASYEFTPQLTGTVGLRRFSYNSTTQTAETGFLTSGSNSGSGERDQGVTPKFDLSYKVDANLLLYTTLAKGFRPGGGNQAIPTSGPLGSACEANLQANHGTTQFVSAPLAYSPDNVWSVEAGEKAKLLDSAVTINSSAYFERWQAVQQYVTLACGFPYTDNSGDAHIYGTEVEIKADVAPGLVLSANVGYTHAYFVIGSLEAGITPGTRVQDVPDWTSSLSLSYQRQITDQLAFTSRAENNYVGSRTDETYVVNTLPAYDLTNLRAGIAGDRWSAVVFANNVTNKRALLTDTPQVVVSIPTFNRVAVNQPLTVGIDLSYRFGRR